MKSILGNFYRHLAIYSGHTDPVFLIRNSSLAARIRVGPFNYCELWPKREILNSSYTLNIVSCILNLPSTLYTQSYILFTSPVLNILNPVSNILYFNISDTKCSVYILNVSSQILTE